MATADRDSDIEKELAAKAGSGALPNARLNPLLNPILAQHLGRWAHIYYTTPVDKREAAVETLVRELEAEASIVNGTAAANPATSSPVRSAVESARASKPEIAESSTPSAVLVMPPQTQSLPAEESQRRTQEVSKLSEDMSEAAGPSVAVPPVIESLIEPMIEPGTEPEPPAESRGLVASLPWERIPQSSEAETAEFVPEANAPSATVTRPSAAEDYRAFGDLLAKSDAAMEVLNSPPPSARRWQVPIVAASILVLLGTALWIARASGGKTSAESAHAAKSASTPLASSAPASSAPASSAPVSSAPASPAPGSPATSAPAVATAQKPQPPSGLEAAPVRPAVAPMLKNAADRTGVGVVSNLNSPPPPDGTQPLDPEMAAGMRSLQGNGVPRDSAEAVRHFWQSAKNQNTSALGVLAGLYAQGDGVTKDCDQARVLFDAAWRQATSRQPQSRIQTRQLENVRDTLHTAGCQ